MSRKVDVLIVGSGPAGCTYARQLHEIAPHADILMVEAGPALTPSYGSNVRNLTGDARADAQRRSEGRRARLDRTPLVARPGTHLVRPFEGGSEQRDMPAAAMSTNVGGMSAHWTCASPRPAGSERTDLIDGAELDAAFDRAEKLLRVTTTAFPGNPTTDALMSLLRDRYTAGSGGRPVQPMPLACTPGSAPLPTWSGSAEILGALAAPGACPTFELRASTLCVRLLVTGDRVTHAELRDLTSGATEKVAADHFVVAGDALRTPQLLWNSGIRPTALGHYLNDQPQIVSKIQLDPAKLGLVDPQRHGAAQQTDLRDQLTGVIWVPFDDETHRCHGQIMQLDTAPIDLPGAESGGGTLVGFGWFTAKDVRFDDRVEFDDAQTDEFGMPSMRIHHTLTDEDLRRIQDAIADIDGIAEILGSYVDGGRARLVPSGSSLHYQGSFRIGAHDDGGSVCDPTSKVWGLGNLYLGGNGLIPTSTACNPTLTSVAFAVVASTALAARLGTSNV